MSDENQVQEFPVVFMPCKRGKDVMTSGQSCNSREAYKLSKDGDRVASFKCKKCSHAWSLDVGGTVNI